MKDKIYLMLRAVCVFVIGVLLVAYKEQWAGALVIGVGIVFALFGVCSVVSWLVSKKFSRDADFFPVLGIAGILLGLLLMLASGKFVNIFVYVAGIFLVCLSLMQLFSLLSIHREAKMPSWLFVTPVAALLLGGFALWNPSKAAALPFFLSGVGCIICGLGWMIAIGAWLLRSRKGKAK